MELLQSTELVVPLYQITILLAISTLVLLFGRIKLALMINYIFTLYWGYGVNRDYLIGDRLEGFSMFTFIYFGFGLIIVILALLGFFARNE